MLTRLMLTRRNLLILTAATGLLASVPGLSARAQGADAAAFVSGAARDLIQAMDSAPNEAARNLALQRVVDRTVDVDGIGRFCLGRYWRSATPPQQQQFIQVFHRSLMTSITNRLGEYKGVKLVTGRSTQTDEGTLVQSTVTRPGQQPVQVGWLVASVGGQQKVVDVVAEGTSLRLTQRSDYTSFLAQNNGNLQALIEGLLRQEQAQK